MAYTPINDYSDSLGTGHGVDLDEDFASIAATTVAIEAKQALVQRSDGAVKNGVVTFDSLNADVRQLLLLDPDKYKGEWQTGVVYRLGEFCTSSNQLYISTVTHYGGASFSADDDLGRWVALTQQYVSVPSVLSLPASPALVGDAQLIVYSGEAYVWNGSSWSALSGGGGGGGAGVPVVTELPANPAAADGAHLIILDGRVYSWSGTAWVPQSPSQSTNFDPDVDGWSIQPNGDVQFNQGEFRGINVFDSSGTLILAAGEGVIWEHLSGAPSDAQILNSLLPYAPVEGTGDQPAFTKLGSANETILSDEGPYNTSLLAWEVATAAGSGVNGGWQSDAIAINPSKTYRFSVWFKASATLTGTVEFAPSDDDVLPVGASPSPAEFIEEDVTGLTADKWYLFIGIVHGKSYTGTGSSVGGVYDALTGGIVLAGSDYKFDPAANSVRHIVRLRDAAATTSVVFTMPRVDLLDGTEIPIAAMMQPAAFLNSEVTLEDLGYVGDVDATKQVVFEQEESPIGSSNRDFWYKPSTFELKRWNGATWIPAFTLTPENADVYIASAAIGSAQIGSINAAVIQAGIISAEIELEAAFISGGSMNIADKFLVSDTGVVTIREVVGGATGMTINSAGVYIRDESGNLIIELGELL